MGIILEYVLWYMCSAKYSVIRVLFCLFLFFPPRGDIVIAKSPNDPKSNICKRVIGLEGDKVCTSNPSDFLKSHSYVSISFLICK